MFFVRTQAFPQMPASLNMDTSEAVFIDLDVRGVAFHRLVLNLQFRAAEANIIVQQFNRKLDCRFVFVHFFSPLSLLNRPYSFGSLKNKYNSVSRAGFLGFISIRLFLNAFSSNQSFSINPQAA